MEMGEQTRDFMISSIIKLKKLHIDVCSVSPAQHHACQAFWVICSQGRKGKLVFLSLFPGGGACSSFTIKRGEEKPEFLGKAKLK